MGAAVLVGGSVGIIEVLHLHLPGATGNLERNSMLKTNTQSETLQMQVKQLANFSASHTIGKFHFLLHGLKQTCHQVLSSLLASTMLNRQTCIKPVGNLQQTCIHKSDLYARANFAAMLNAIFSF